MSDVARERGDPMHEALIVALVEDLRPVRRLGSPGWNAASWLASVGATAVALACFADLHAMEHRLMAVPDMWLAVIGSTLTIVLAAFAASQLARPDRSPRWALLPAPGLVLWIGASGMGCARTWLVSGTSDATMGETMTCLTFILALSVPLSTLMFVTLRRGYSLYPALTGAMAGLAVAAAAATLLNFFHPYDAAVTDLAVHAVAVVLVVIANRFIGAIRLGRRGARPMPD
jgi:hypothetical protein